MKDRRPQMSDEEIERDLAELRTNVIKFKVNNLGKRFNIPPKKRPRQRKNK